VALASSQAVLSRSVTQRGGEIMKRLCAGLVLAGMLVSVCEEASAQTRTYDVQELLGWCKEAATAHAYYCVGLVEGMSEMTNLNGLVLKDLRKPEANEVATFAICQSSGTSTGAGVQAFINWAEKHPERWSQPYSVGVVDSLRELWPCSASK